MPITGGGPMAYEMKQQRNPAVWADRLYPFAGLDLDEIKRAKAKQSVQRGETQIQERFSPSTGTQMLEAHACEHNHREGIHKKQGQSQERRLHEREHTCLDCDPDKDKRCYPI